MFSNWNTASLVPIKPKIDYQYLNYKNLLLKHLDMFYIMEKKIIFWMYEEFSSVFTLLAA